MKKKAIISKLFLSLNTVTLMTLVSCNDLTTNNNKTSNGEDNIPVNTGDGINKTINDNPDGNENGSSTNTEVLPEGNTDSPIDTEISTYNRRLLHYVEAPNAPTYSGDGGEVDVYINYSGSTGVCRAPNIGSVTDPITSAQTAPGVMLPTWRAFQSYTNTTIKDATYYSSANNNIVWTNVTSNDFKSEQDSTRTIDIIYNSTENFDASTNKLMALDEYIDAGKMPNFKVYLDENPDVKKMITKNGKIYYTPFFDGQDDIERMFIMDTSLTKKVLDSTSGWDTTTTNGGSNPSSNVVQGGFYQPFMNEYYNYDENKNVKILFENTVKEVTILKTTNIIKQQNELLSKGCTGQELAEQFICYIKTAYANFFDASKNSANRVIYKNPSDLFISESAAYNPDELIALMRVVKANPGMISGNANSEITTFFPRAVSNNRIDNIYDFAQIWGIQGVDGENGNFYIGGDGKVHALETTQASYDSLEYLSQIYDEGLILKNFYKNDKYPSGHPTCFLDKYYKKNTEDAKYGFLMYDYAGATCSANDLYEGLGTNPSSRKNGFDEKNKYGLYDFVQVGISPILAPLTYWATEKKWSPDQSISDTNGKTLTRYYESNRSLQKWSWAIPANSDNVNGAIRLMDIMFSELGQMINSFGPCEYWAKPNKLRGDTLDSEYDPNKIYVSDNLVKGELNPIVSKNVKNSLSAQSGDFSSYSKGYLGSTHSIGNVRSKGFQIQSINYFGQKGLMNIQDAFTIGNNDIAGDGSVLKLATISKIKENGETIYTWNTSVPSDFTKLWSDDACEYTSLTGFWASNKLNSNTGWVNAITRGHKNDISACTVYAISGDSTFASTYSKVLEERNVFNKKALYTYAYSITNSDKYVPTYAKPSA